jgi:hypothetical protein
MSQRLKAESSKWYQLPGLSLRLSDGGGERDRTDDLLRAKQVLSQLSYTPVPDTGIPSLDTRSL